MARGAGGEGSVLNADPLFSFGHLNNEGSVASSFPVPRLMTKVVVGN